MSLFILSALPVLAAESQTAATVDRPNVVLIMTDNHGAWTLGCYGNEEIRTPNIDRLATEGTLFDNAFASNPVCSPTRATTLTGLIPSQHGVHCFLRGGRLQTGPEARNTLAEFTSIPEVLKQNGYRCGLVGKWHLGANMSPQESFDDYWITMPHGGTSTFYDAQIIEDGKLRTEPEYLTDFWTKHAVRFIEGKNQTDAVASLPLDSDTSLAAASCESDDASSCDSAPDGATDCSRGRQPTATTFNPTPQARIHQPAPPRLRHRVKQPENASRLKQQVAQTFVSVNDKQPFFLFLAYNGPYSLSRLLLREGRNRHADFYRDQPLLSFPREKAHPWQLHNLDFHNNPVSIRRVATEVSGVDDGVGTVMAALKENGLDDNTIVIFMAD
ncbi:MAG: sulfatase-like hydrolase/transferase, partial [Planctomycetaceae bacterium]|nr:sulfatase-like hydrolase/transferase [Planctomycetaceae bacterium]